MTKEHVAEFLNELTLGEVAMLAEMATKRREEMEGVLKAEAEERFIQAYKDFRKLAPHYTKYKFWEYETDNGDWEGQEFDLYEMMDAAFDIE